ncbi:hypothetical protein HDU92_007440, partial [Lobulomyces angularis]
MFQSCLNAFENSLMVFRFQNENTTSFLKALKDKVLKQQAYLVEGRKIVTEAKRDNEHLKIENIKLHNENQNLINQLQQLKQQQQQQQQYQQPQQQQHHQQQQFYKSVTPMQQTNQQFSSNFSQNSQREHSNFYNDKIQPYSNTYSHNQDQSNNFNYSEANKNGPSNFNYSYSHQVPTSINNINGSNLKNDHPKQIYAEMPNSNPLYPPSFKQQPQTRSSFDSPIMHRGSSASSQSKRNWKNNFSPASEKMDVDSKFSPRSDSRLQNISKTSKKQNQPITNPVVFPSRPARLSIPKTSLPDQPPSSTNQNFQLEMENLKKKKEEKKNFQKFFSTPPSMHENFQKNSNNSVNNNNSNYFSESHVNSLNVRASTAITTSGKSNFGEKKNNLFGKENLMNGGYEKTSVRTNWRDSLKTNNNTFGTRPGTTANILQKPSVGGGIASLKR